MLKLSLSDLPRLIEVSEEACVSLYVRGGRAGLTSGTAVTSYRHLLRRADAALQQGVHLRVREKVLAPLRVFSSVVDRASACAPQGLALFSSPSLCGFFPLMDAPQNSVVVSRSFHIKPLLPYLDPGMRWACLDVRPHEARLFLCAARCGEPEASCALGSEMLRLRPECAAKLVDWVEGILGSETRSPLIVRAPVELHARLEGLRSLSSLAAPFVHSVERVLPDDILVSAMAKHVQPTLDECARRFLDGLHDEHARGRAATTPEAALARLKSGALRQLVLRDEGPMWGHIDWRKGEVDLAPAPPRGFGDCVLDDLAERALKERCRVAAAREADLPSGVALLAR